MWSLWCRLVQRRIKMPKMWVKRMNIKYLFYLVPLLGWLAAVIPEQTKFKQFLYKGFGRSSTRVILFTIYHMFLLVCLSVGLDYYIK